MPKPMGTEPIEDSALEEGAQSPAGVSLGETTGEGLSDAEREAALVARLRDEVMAEVGKKYEADIAKLKSVKDREIHQTAERVRKEAEAEFQKRMRELQLQGLDDGERQKFESQYLKEDYERTRQENLRYQQMLAERDAMISAADAFVQMGVPRDRLPLDQGMDALVSAGWEAVRTRLSELEAKAAGAKGKPEPEETDKKEATPKVLTSTRKASSGMTWRQLIERYKSVDEVFRLIETGALSPDILPSE